MVVAAKQALALTASRPVRLRTSAPTSKSVTNRELLMASLANGLSRLDDPLLSDDTHVMRAALADVGVRCEERDGAWLVEGGVDRLSSPRRPLHAGLSGTTMRFLTALLPLLPAGGTITGDPPLLRRPIGPVVSALRQLGARVSDRNGHPPVESAGGGLDGGTVQVDAAASSQFASAVLLVAPYARGDVTIDVLNVSAPGYIATTVELMRRRGITVDQTSTGAWQIAAGQQYRPADTRIEYDASAAAHLFSLAMASGGQVTVDNVSRTTAQPDARILPLFAAMGAQITTEGTAVSVQGPEVLRPLSVNLRSMPDQVATVAVLCALAPGDSLIRGVEIVRGHETDRLRALAIELRKVGVDLTELPDGLAIRGGRPLRPARLSTYDDHRLAMAFAALAARLPHTVILEAGCVAKTFPRFWQECAAAGLEWRLVDSDQGATEHVRH
jgi:3-phosphoshikimate 1-carboxyvinyltransferase